MGTVRKGSANRASTANSKRYSSPRMKSATDFGSKIKQRSTKTKRTKKDVNPSWKR